MSGETAVANIGAYSPSQYITQMYANMVGGLDGISTSGVGMMDADLGYNSIFGMNGMGFNKSWQQLQNMTMDEQSAYYGQKMYGTQADNGLYQYNKSKSISFQAHGIEDAITRQASNLQTAIKENNQAHVIEEYDKLRDLVRAQLVNTKSIKVPKNVNFEDLDSVTKNTIKTEVGKAYTVATNGGQIASDLEKHGESWFVQGLREGTGVGILFNPSGKNYRESLSEITGVDEVKQSAEFLKWSGRVLAGVATLAIGIPLLALGTKVLGGGSAKAAGKLYEAAFLPKTVREARAAAKAAKTAEAAEAAKSAKRVANK